MQIPSSVPFLLIKISSFRSVVREQKEIVSDVLRRGDKRLADNQWWTSSILGLISGLEHVQRSAHLMTEIISTALLFSGSGRRGSNMSLISKDDPCWVDKDDKSSPGWAPITTSRVSTPKLYTSHFSVTCMV